MRVYIVIPTEEYYDSSTKLYVFANKADAEEMILSLSQEELYECVNTCLQDEMEEDLCCVPERIVPWEDEVYVNCNHCEKKCCPSIQMILGDYEQFLGTRWEIIETELL